MKSLSQVHRLLAVRCTCQHSFPRPSYCFRTAQLCGHGRYISTSAGSATASSSTLSQSSKPRSQPSLARKQTHNPFAPSSKDRGPTSSEDTQTDFGTMDIFSNIAEAATSIDACTTDGFHLNNGVKITGGAAVLLAGGEAWSWKPWNSMTGQQSSKIGDLLDARRGTLNFPHQAWGLLALLHPKPDLLIVGTGSRNWMLAPDTKKYLMEELGIRVDVMDTANASAAYNLLAKERGVEGGAGVGGAFLPIGWKGPQGAGRKS